MSKDLEKILEKGSAKEILECCFEEDGLSGEVLERIVDQLHGNIERGAALCFQALREEK